MNSKQAEFNHNVVASAKHIDTTAFQINPDEMSQSHQYWETRIEDEFSSVYADV